MHYVVVRSHGKRLRSHVLGVSFKAPMLSVSISVSAATKVMAHGLHYFYYWICASDGLLHTPKPLCRLYFSVCLLFHWYLSVVRQFLFVMSVTFLSILEQQFLCSMSDFESQTVFLGSWALTSTGFDQKPRQACHILRTCKCLKV